MTIHLVAATEIVRAVVPPALRVVGSRELHGRMVSEVVEWQTDATPGAVVAKIGRDQESCAALQQEQVALRHLKAATRLPVPLAYGLVRRDAGPETVLVLAKVTGRNMAEAALSEAGTIRLQREIARHVAGAA